MSNQGNKQNPPRGNTPGNGSPRKPITNSYGGGPMPKMPSMPAPKPPTPSSSGKLKK